MRWAADVPTGLVQQNRDPTVTESTVLTGQGDDRLGQLIFVVPLHGLIPLGSSRLAHQAARLSFTQSFLPSVLDGDAAPLGT